tara:strand:+ start:3372 stop:5393 length:2022 start_codon:yes stop_codon:yes gene_type:complete
MKNTRLRNTKGQFKKASKVSEFGFVNLSTYTSPEIKEVNGEDWIEYGADNNYFQYLIDRYNGSPTNNAAINGISQAIYGKGLNATDGNRKPNEYAQMISLFKKDVVRKLCYDLKLMGQCAMQVIYSKDRKKIAQVEHMPIETLRAEKCNDDGDIPAYYYFKDWANIKRSDEPLRIPAFGMSKENIEIYYIKPYKSGFYYYSPVDYQGGLQYAELEEEVSNYHLNNIMNGLAPSMLINFNNGTPNQEERQLIESKIAAKFSGSSNAGKFILAFNDNKESQAEITPVQLSDAHNQYQFLSEEAQSKIQVSHRVVSPFLLGIRTSTGFSSNADEIKTASLLMDNTVIRPFQELLIDSFDQILAYNEIALNLYFTTLQPLEFTEIDSKIQDKEDIEEETGVEMQKFNLKMIDGTEAYKTIEEAEAKAEEQGCKGHHEHSEDGEVWYMPCESHPIELSEDESENIIGNLSNSGVEMSEDYVFVDEINAEDDVDNEGWAKYLITEKKSVLSKIKKIIGLKDEVTSYKKGNAFSVLDSPNGLYKIRYKYAIGSTKQMEPGNESRVFCRNMMNMANANILWRIEDIDEASREGVNKQLGHKGKKYDLFKFKGGVYCRHIFKKVLYRLRANTEESNNIADYKVTRKIPAKYNRKPRGSKEAAKAPVNMPNSGHYPGWKPKKK